MRVGESESESELKEEERPVNVQLVVTRDWRARCCQRAETVALAEKQKVPLPVIWLLFLADSSSVACVSNLLHHSSARIAHQANVDLSFPSATLAINLNQWRVVPVD